MSEFTVFYDGSVVGTAVPNEQGRLAFEYALEWLGASRAFAISVSLPLREPAFLPSEAHNFFANLLPEGPSRIAICAKLGISPDNDVGLLEALGGDTAGALQFLDPAKLPAPRARRPITPDELARWSRGAPAVLDDEERPARLSLAGAQHKTTVVANGQGWSLPSSDEASTHILKFDSPSFSHLSANEYLTMQLAQSAGLETAVCRLATFQPRYLTLERYDRLPINGRVSRVHQEDFCQALGFPPFRKYEADGGPTLRQVAEKLREVSAQPAQDVLSLLNWTIFCALSGNADGHAKNLSLVRRDRKIVLAPFYDLVCTRAYPSLSPELAFSIGGGRNPDTLSRENWRGLANDLGVGFKLVARRIEAIRGTLEERLFENAPDVDTPIRNQIEKAIGKRIRASQRWL